MTLDVNQPTDQVSNSELPSYIREDRAAINAISGSGNVGVTDLTVPSGTISLTVGSDLGDYGLEIVNIEAAALVTLATILGGTNGQVKIFIFQDANIDLTDGAKAGGAFYLNQLPALSDYSPSQDAILALANIGGDGASNHGYWKELFRTTPVK